MADVKISELTALTSANVDASGDVLAVVDTSATATRKITVENLLSPITINKATDVITDLGTVSGATSITSTAFVGPLTGDVTGNVSGTAPAGTLTGSTLASGVTASSLTSVGTLTGLTVENGINTASFDGDDADCLAIFQNTQNTDNAGGSYIKLDTTRAGENMGIVWNSQDDNDSRFVFVDNRGGNGYHRMAFDNNGKVGIGTTNPTGKLTIAGASGVASNFYLDNHSDDGDGCNIIFRKSHNATIGGHAAVESGDAIGTIFFQGSDTDSYETGALIRATADENWSGSALGTALTFHTVDNTTTTLDERMRIDHNGKVGIGTTGPTAKLEISAAQSDTMTDDTAFLALRGGGGDGILMGQRSTDPYAAWIQAGYLANIGNTHHYPLSLQPHGGNVGIGTTVPKTALHVQGASSYSLTTCGAMRFTGNNGASGNMQTIEWTDSDSRTEPAMSIGYLGESSGGQGWGSFFVMTTIGSATGAAIRFKVISTGDTYTNDGSVSSLSDKRAKKNIIDLEDGLSIVNQLKPKTFQYNGKTDLGVDDGKTRFGFIADDVLEVASQYVEIGSAKIDGAEVDDFKSLSTGRMIPMMVKSIQELSTANDELKARIEALENA